MAAGAECEFRTDGRFLHLWKKVLNTMPANSSEFGVRGSGNSILASGSES